MRLSEAGAQLKKAGYTWPEVRSMINRLTEQHNIGTSRRSELRKLAEIREVFIEAGINPDDIEFEPWRLGYYPNKYV